MRFAKRHAVAAAALTMFTACGGGAGDTGPVSIHGSDLHVTDVGTQEVPFDFVTLTASYVDAEGEFATLAIDPVDGVATLADAPDGEYYLQFWRAFAPPAYVVTSERQVDLGRVRLGRPGIYDEIEVGGPLVTVNVTGLESWQVSDQLHLYSVGADGYEPNMAQPGRLDMSFGDTNAGGVFQTENIASGSMPGGDRVWLYQLSTRSLVQDGGTYQALSRAFNSGETSNGFWLQGSMDVVDQTESITVDWRAGEFAGMRGKVHAAAQPGFTLLYVSALAGDAAWGQYGKSADLAFVRRGLDEATDVVATLSYGDPFPDEWTRFAIAQNWYRTGFTFGASLATDVWATTTSARTLGTGELLIAPEIDPPSNVLVDGSPAIDGAAVSLEPLIEWTAPARGSADYYQVRVVALSEIPGARALVNTVAMISTTESSVRLPPGVIEDRALRNHGYVLVISAVSAPEMDPAKPLIIPWPLAHADTIVGVLIPPAG